jgi:branched-chain amino acid transport system substrate-binding protein
MQAAREAGITSTLIGPSFMGLPELASEALTVAGGTYFSEVALGAGHFPNTGQFDAEYAERFGEPPGAFSALAYDAMGVCLDSILRAAQEAGGLPPRALVTQAVRDTKFEGITGPLTFAPNGDRDPAPYFMVQMTAGSPEAWPDNPVFGPYYLSPP